MGQLALGLEQTLLEGAHSLGRLLEAPSQRDDLLLERGSLLPQLLDAVVVGVASSALHGGDTSRAGVDGAPCPAGEGASVGTLTAPHRRSVTTRGSDT